MSTAFKSIYIRKKIETHRFHEDSKGAVACILSNLGKVNKVRDAAVSGRFEGSSRRHPFESWEKPGETENLVKCW